MEPTSFSVRLGYLRWLQHLLSGEAPGHAEIGRAVGVTGQAVMKWMEREDPPVNFRMHAPLASFFDADEKWLIRGEGEPQRPDLWAEWTKARRRQVKAAPVEAFVKVPRSRAKKKASGDR